MKHLYVSAFLLLLSFTSQSQAQFTGNIKDQDLTAKKPSTDWYNRAAAAMTDKQMSFRKLDENNYGVANTANRMGCIIDASGYTVKNIVSTREKDWQTSFKLISVNGVPYEDARAVATMNEKKLSFTTEHCSIEYINSERGVRQNFILAEKHGTPGNAELLLQLSSSLKVSLYKDQLGFKDAAGQTKLLYDGLKVWDADHTALPAHFVLEENMLRVVVDDSHAVYPVTIDPLNHSPSWSDNGNGLLFPLLNDLTAHVLFGFSVSSAGDINNDSYSDLIVGAPAFVDIISVSGGTYNLLTVGAAFVYYGGPGGLAGSPNEVLQPTTEAGALFGYSVSVAGDVNGDGYSDVVVGAPGDHTTLNIGLVIPVATSVATGKVYVYYGGPAGDLDGNVNTEPTVSISLSLHQPDFGPLAIIPVNPLYGYSVSTAGDVNGDGKADVIVGSPAYTRLLPLPIQSGRVDIFYGSNSGLSAGSMHTITGTTLNALFGYSVSTAGNVNNDKNGAVDIDDIIVGAPGDITFIGAGQAYIFHGNVAGISANTNLGANISLNSGFLTTLFGFSVATAGDVNADGYADVIIGEPLALENFLAQLVSVGSAHIYYGSPTGISASGSTTLASPYRPSILGLIQGNLLYGFSVKTAGDVNCDGASDIIVGEPGGTALSLGSGVLGLVSTNSVSGRAYIYYGKPGGPVTTPSYTIMENGPVTVANMIGYSVSAMGDINGDFKADVVVGAPNGTVDLSAAIIPLVGDAIGIVENNSIGSVYGFIGCLNITLPVTLTEFTANVSGKSVAVNWKTEKELNLDRYEVEYSTTGQNFTTLAIVFPSTGNTNSYGYLHNSPSTVNYYRLKIIDLDGSFRYSEIRVVKFTGKEQVQILVYPNPAKGYLQFNLDGLPKGNYSARLISVTGQVEIAKAVVVEAAGQRHRIMLDNVTPGTHLLVIYDKEGKKVGTSTVVVQ